MRSRGTIASRLLALALSASLAGSTLVVAPTLAGAQQPSAQQKRDEAVQRYQKGVEFFQEGDFQASLIEFKRSYELVPNFNVLYNIGQVYFQLQDYANALKTLEQYLEDGAKRIPASRRADVEKDVEKLKARVATVTIKVNAPGAEITVDDVVVGTSPLPGPITVSAGRRRFAASKEGAGSARKVEEIAGNDAKEIALELSLNAPAATGEPGGDGGSSGSGGATGNGGASGGGDVAGGPAAPAEPESDFPILPVVAWSVTGALAITTGVFGGLALGADSDLQDKKAEPGNSTEDLDAAASKASTMALVSDVFLVATIVGAGVATTFTILEITSDDGPDATARGPAPATARWVVGPGFTGVSGTF